MHLLLQVLPGYQTYAVDGDKPAPIRQYFNSLDNELQVYTLGKDCLKLVIQGQLVQWRLHVIV